MKQVKSGDQLNVFLHQFDARLSEEDDWKTYRYYYF